MPLCGTVYGNVITRSKMEFAYKIILVVFFTYESYFLFLSSRTLSQVAIYLKNENVVLWGKAYSNSMQLSFNRNFSKNVMSLKTVNAVTNEFLKEKLLRLRFLYRMEIFGVFLFFICFVSVILANDFS
jgi:hypothetical protein